MRKTHELKILPLYFDGIIKGKKTFEVRRNDRGYKVGDILVLREYNTRNNYTGSKVTAEVTYILDKFEGIKEGYVVMGIKVIKIKI